MRVFVFAAVMMFTSQVSASVSDRFLQTHREWCFASQWYEERIAKELHVPMQIVQDFLNAYSLYFTQGAFLTTTRNVMYEHPQLKQTIVSAFLIHRLLYWVSSAAQYVGDNPVSFLTHAVLYQSFLWSARLVPHWVDNLDGHFRGRKWL